MRLRANFSTFSFNGSNFRPKLRLCLWLIDVDRPRCLVRFVAHRFGFVPEYGPAKNKKGAPPAKNLLTPSTQKRKSKNTPSSKWDQNAFLHNFQQDRVVGYQRRTHSLFSSILQPTNESIQANKIRQDKQQITMDFTQQQQQQQYGAPPTGPAWQTTAPQKQASTMNMMGGGAPPAPSTNPFENNGGYGAPTSPAPRMQQHQQPMQAQADSRAPEFDPSSPGTPGQRMPTSPMQQQQQPQAQPNANDPFASVSPVSVAAASATAPLMQGQPPNAAGLRQPSLGMNGANQGQQQPQQAPNSTNPFEQPNEAPPTSPAPAPQAQPNANADPFASFGAVAAPTSPAPAPQAPAPAPMGAPPAPPSEAPPAAPPVAQPQPSFEGLSHANQVHGSESFASGGVPTAPSQDMSQQPQPPVQQNQYQPPPPQQQPPAAPTQQQPQQQQAWNQPAQQQPAPNALVQATQPQQQQQAYSNYNLGTGYPASNEQPPQQQPPASPYQQQQPQPQQNHYQQSQQQLVAAPAADPFGVFNQEQQAPAPAPTQAPPPAPAQENNDDFWGAFANTASPATANTQDGAVASQQPSTPLTLGENGLPDGGEIYNARVSVPMLGVLFFKGADLAKSIFSEANPEAINSLGKRATVGHVFEGSAAHAAGIGLGHVLLKVNGKECRSADEAAHLIRNTPRPLNLECWAPPKEHLKVSVWEGKHMVKYDTKEKYAPQSKWEWKPKYVVVGGVIANPLQMNMYRSKAEYDTAVKEVQGGETKVSVKVKQFDLYNAHIVLGRNGQPRAVDYLETWHYLVIVPLEGNPIKIAATSPERLVPVHTGIQKALNDAKIQARAVREEEEEYARQHGGYRETQSGNRYYGDDAPVVRSRHYDAYGGNDYYQQQQQQQPPAYSSPPPQQISYDHGYGGDYNQGYAQQPQQQQQQSNSATPWASY